MWTVILSSSAGLAAIATALLTLTPAGQELGGLLLQIFGSIILGIGAWVFDAQAWTDAAVWALAHFFAMMVTFLPEDVKYQIGTGISWFQANSVITLAFKVVWWFLNLFVNGPILLVVISLYLVVYPTAWAIQLAKALYDLFPTRG